MTFAPKDVVPVDFTPKVDSHGLGYRGLNPLQALGGRSGSGHINLFTLQSDRTTSLFGDRESGQQRRGGIAGQVRSKCQKPIINLKGTIILKLWCAPK